MVIKNLIGALGALRAGKRVVVDLMDYWHCNKPYVVFNSLDFYILRRARCVIAWSKAIAGFMKRYLGRRCVAYLPFGVNLALADPL
ncbi:MAG: glycosyltransferase family 1 protein, partial [Pyrobaculum sp.]